MTILSFITPISYNKIRKLEITEYVLLYLNKKNKLKRAIPDFEEMFISRKSSLIDEAISSNEVALFKIVKSNEYVKTPVFCVYTNSKGEIERYDSFDDSANKLEDFLCDSKSKQSLIKMLKKTR